MDLLFKREQTSGKIGRVNFKLWAKIELDETEKSLVSRYKFDQSQILEETQPKLLQNSTLLGLLAGFIAYLILDLILPNNIAIILALAAGGGAAYWFYNEKREVLFMRDLLHGRHFTCPSIIDLAKKEARLGDVSAVLRQVLESATRLKPCQKKKRGKSCSTLSRCQSILVHAYMLWSMVCLAKRTRRKRGRCIKRCARYLHSTI